MPLEEALKVSLTRMAEQRLFRWMSLSVRRGRTAVKNFNVCEDYIVIKTRSLLLLSAITTLSVLVACSSSSVPMSAGSSPSIAAASSHVVPQVRILPGPKVMGPLLLPLAPRPWNLPRRWPRTKSGQILFVADPNDNQVLMYDPTQANPSPLGSITEGINGPMGVAVDKLGQVYVVNIGNNTVTIYPHGSVSPSLTIEKGLWAPAGIGVDSKGNVFVANEEQFVTGYRPGRKTPFETIPFRTIGCQAIGLAVDAADTVWVVCDNLDSLWTIARGKKKAQNANLSGLGGPMGVSFGRDGMMYVSNYAASNVLVFAPGTTSPALTITDGIDNPTFNGVSASGRFFQSNTPGNVVGYKEGRTKPFTTITTTPNPWGVAAYPPVNQ